ncbi:MAG TPA: Tim44/TimA family putative adaptor protein [Devosia sp.]|nr:Tim44/TimA family putative adaptor protein [Devosia sp.]
MAEFLDIPTLVIIGIAVFVLLRLRSVLGTRTGNERPPSSRIRPRLERAEQEDVVVPLHPSNVPGQSDENAARAARKFEAELDRYVGTDKNLRKSLLEIAQVDSNFSPKTFLDGAGQAYEMIVTAFARGDKATLKDLLQRDVFEEFESAINAREKAGHSVDFTFVGLPNIEIVEAELEKRIASITIRFDAEIVSATKDKAGKLVEGNEEQVVNISDEWTFARNTKSRDPNWKLVATNQLS